MSSERFFGWAPWILLAVLVGPAGCGDEFDGREPSTSGSGAGASGATGAANGGAGAADGGSGGVGGVGGDGGAASGGAPGCDEGTADCDGDESNGCETETSSDPAHCGRCGTVCNTQCVSSVCNDAVVVDAGGWNTCVVRALGDVWCWGENTWGQLGDGTDDSSATPIKVALPGPAVNVVVSPDALRMHACALMESGELYCWGCSTKRSGRHR
jgi:hypothetical protein